MTILRVGLTGGIAAGKSTVAGWLRQAGCFVVDADRLVAELYRPGGSGAAAVERLFGASYLDSEGRVDHQGLAAEVFGDDNARKRLEAAIHPLVRSRFEELIAGRDGIVVLEATLLVESGMAAAFDLVVTVEADPSLRLKRAVERGLDEVAVRRRLAAQGDGEERRLAADLVLWNNGGEGQLRRQVDRLIADLQRRLGSLAPTSSPEVE